MDLDLDPRVRLLEAGGQALGGVEGQRGVPHHLALAPGLGQPGILGGGRARRQDEGHEDERESERTRTGMDHGDD